MDMESLFGPPISTYSAQQAAEDGILVPVSPKDAVTRTCWEFFCEHAPTDQPPNCWPVDLMGWCRAGKVKKDEALKMIAELGAEGSQAKLVQMGKDGRALAMSRGLIDQHKRAAIRAEIEAEEIYRLWAYLRDGKIISLSGSCLSTTTANPQEMYLRPNELGGVTLMFPEDN